MPIHPAARATAKPHPQRAAKLTLLTPDPTPDLNPDDRVSNYESPPSEASEEDVDDMLERLGVRLEFVDPEVRFAEWYDGKC
jgi:hypothetical protein